MAKNSLAGLQKMLGAVVDDTNPFANVIQSPIPTYNYLFGNTQGHPRGYTVVLYGPPKSGKSELLHAIIGQLHKDDPTAIALKFNTEYRERVQLTPVRKKLWGIDPTRYQAIETNHPGAIFDSIADTIVKECQAGKNIALVAVDSINGVLGRRSADAESVMDQQIGDEALTLQVGLKRILPVIRKYNIALILTAHVRAELDPIQAKRSKTRMAAAWALQHFAEYFIYVEKKFTQATRTDMFGNPFEDASGAILGAKIEITMKDSSLGPRGRNGQFTYFNNAGVVNTYEEIFTLGKEHGILERPNNRTYRFGGKEWDGWENMVRAIKEDSELGNRILAELRAKDVAGLLSAGGSTEATPALDYLSEV